MIIKKAILNLIVNQYSDYLYLYQNQERCVSFNQVDPYKILSWLGYITAEVGDFTLFQKEQCVKTAVLTLDDCLISDGRAIDFLWLKKLLKLQ
jgi:hypothetical protein